MVETPHPALWATLSPGRGLFSVILIEEYSQFDGAKIPRFHFVPLGMTGMGVGAIIDRPAAQILHICRKPMRIRNISLRGRSMIAPTRDIRNESTVTGGVSHRI